jgi:transcription antitermination factor NusG
MSNAWYAVRVRSNFEQTTAAYLEAVGHQVFVPTYEQRKQGSDRIRRVRLPLFPGYVICRMDINLRMPVLTAPGVVHIVGFGNDFVPVPDQEIEAVRHILTAQVQVERWPYLAVGERVRIVEGPLAGLTGILVDVRAKQRLIVSVHLLQRSVAAAVNREAVRPERHSGLLDHHDIRHEGYRISGDS